MDKPIACSIDKPYIFISYAHADKDRVYPFILELQKTYNVWYDDGMRYGEEDYVEFIMDKIDGCTVFLYMVSLNSVKSDFCKKEIRYAKNENKPFINIIMDGNDGSKDYKRFDFDYGLNQNVILSNFTSIGDAFIDMYNRSKDDIKEAFDKCITRKVESDNPVPNVSLDNKKNQIFISYLFSDRDTVLPIIERLKERYNVWYDDGSIDRDDIAVVTKEEIEKSLVFIIFVSNNSVHSKVSYFEAGIAFNNSDTLFYPIMIEHVGDLSVLESFVSKSTVFRLYRTNIDSLLNKISTNVVFNMCLKDKTSIDDNKQEVEESPVIDETFKIRKGTLVKYNGLDKRVIIPDEVKVIANDSFINNRFIEEVIIPEGVSEIGNMAFSDCTSLKKVILPKSLIKIDGFAFSNCPNLEELSFNEGLIEIGAYVLWNCNKIKRLYIPKTVQLINSYAFDSMPSLEAIDVDEHNENYESDLGVLYNIRRTSLIKYPSNKPEDMFRVPTSVKIINTLAFNECHRLEAIIFTSFDLVIQTEAFKNNDVLDVILILGSIYEIKTKGFSNSIPNKIKVNDVHVFNRTILSRDSFYLKRGQGVEAKVKSIPVYDQNDRIVTSIKIKVSVL